MMARSSFIRFFHFIHFHSMHISIHVLLVLYSTKCVSTVHKICIHFEFIKRKCTFRAPCGVFSFMQRKNSCFLSIQNYTCKSSALGKLHFLICVQVFIRNSVIWSYDLIVLYLEYKDCFWIKNIYNAINLRWKLLVQSMQLDFN